MRPRIDGSQDLEGPVGWGRRASAADPRVEPSMLRDLFANAFRHHLTRFFPAAIVEPAGEAADGPLTRARAFAACTRPVPDERGGLSDEVRIFGLRFQLQRSPGAEFSPLERRLVAAIGQVMNAQYSSLFRVFDPARMSLYQGTGEDHFVAAFIDPAVYSPIHPSQSRIAGTIQTLRTAALSTYENRRVSTGAILIGSDQGPGDRSPTPADALAYGVELTSLKSLHRLCDGKRTLFQVDPAGRLAGVIDVGRFAASVQPDETATPPLCARTYQPHARATSQGGHVCLVLSPNQEIKLFARGSQAFVYAHGRWRLIDVESKFGVWCRAVDDQDLARTVFQAALNLAEARHGALFVIVQDLAAAQRLVARHDWLEPPDGDSPGAGGPPEDLLAKRALHYLARGRSATSVDLTVLEALASLDGAVVTDRSGRFLAFGAILRNEGSDTDSSLNVEGARTTAALAASRYGSVLKVSEDGLVSCFLKGARAWEL